MIPNNSNIYLETSAVNYLADQYTWGDGKATRIYHSLKGSSFFISPVTIWEILITSDEGRKEILIHYLQHLCNPKMLNSPSEFIINYLLVGCPIVEKKYEFYSKIDLANVWSDITENTMKTFIYDRNELMEYTNLIRTTFNSFVKGFNEVLSSPTINSGLSETIRLINNILSELHGIKVKEIDEETKLLYKLTILIIYYYFCYEMDYDRSTLKKYWGPLNIKSPIDRLSYLAKYQEKLFYRGPFIVMAKMALVQFSANNKLERSSFWDILHSIYLIYLDVFFTNDEHFLNLRKIGKHEIFNKITHFSEISLVTASNIEIDNETIIK